MIGGTMMLKMLADMAGITPEQLAKEIEGFQNLASESKAALARIERNTQENGAMLRLLLEKEGIEYVGNVSDGRNPGTDQPELPGV